MATSDCWKKFTSNWWRSRTLIIVGCKVKVRKLGQMTNYMLSYPREQIYMKDSHMCVHLHAKKACDGPGSQMPETPSPDRNNMTE